MLVQVLPASVIWGRWCWVSLKSRGVLLIWIIVGQGLTALATGSGWVCLNIFILVYYFCLVSPSLGDGPIQTEILSQHAVLTYDCVISPSIGSDVVRSETPAI